MTTIELKGRTPQEKGEHYLQLSLKALEDLAALLEDKRLSENQRAYYYKIYNTSMARYDDMIGLRNQLLLHKKSFLRKIIVNLFIGGKSDVNRFHKTTYENFSNIRRTSDDLHRLFLPDENAIFASPKESAQGDVSGREESPRDVVEGNRLVKDLPPDEIIRGLTVEVHDTQEEQQVLATLNRIKNSGGAEEDEGDEDEDDNWTIRPKPSQSRPSSPTPSCTIIRHNYYFNQSVASFDSELSGTTLNIGVDGGAGSSSGLLTDTNQPPSQ